MLIPKPLYGYFVYVETSYNAPEKTGLQNCGGKPKLKIKLPGAPSALGMVKKGITTPGTADKTNYAPGENTPAVLTSTGDACPFQWRVRKLPLVNIGDGIVLRAGLIRCS